ncbi:MAG: arsenate reductase ArsC [Candidatus Cloacimonetes bacterium]|nr:arsenate reductase ArsC [Candidatus Cloacimonadota bacterium]
MKKVLFLCTGNSCRSQMAEGFLKDYPGFEVFSAGTKPACEVDPSAVKVMKEFGIDLTKQHPKSVTEFLNYEFDYVITVCDAARESCPIFSGRVVNRLHISFEDPQGKPLETFRRIRNEIRQMIEKLVLTVKEKK